jgi:AcrR family transcriptional regulator
MSTSFGAASKKGAYHHGDLKNALIRAGVSILAKEGVSALSLRRVAQKAGVSHAAPYAHFADKQTLVAAIATEGYRRLYKALRAAIESHPDDPAAQLVEGAWAYVKFSLDDPDYFRVALSGVVEKEKEFPALVEISQQSFAELVAVVSACQKAGILKPGPADLVAVAVWSLLHGLASLLPENQVPHTVSASVSMRDLVVRMLEQIALVPLAPRRRS